MKRLPSIFLLSVLIPSCSESASQQQQQHISIHTREAPALIAFREESSMQWQPLSAATAGTYDTLASGPYRVVIACDPVDDYLVIREYARTPADPPMIEYECASYPFFAHVEVVGAGGIFLGSWGVRTDLTSWNVDLPAASGSFDLIMLSGSPRFTGIASRRAVAITGDTQLGTIDMSSEIMRPLTSKTFTPLNFEPGERTFSTTTLFAGNTIASVDESFLENRPSWIARIAPDDALQAADHQVVSLSATMAVPMGTITQFRYRNVRHEVREGTKTSVSLPEPMHGARFQLAADRLVASWGSLPEHDELVLERTGMSNDGKITVTHEAVVSADYMVSTGTTSIALDLTDIPGFQTQWRQDPASQQILGLFADSGSTYDSTSSGVFESLGAAPPRPASVASRTSYRGPLAERRTRFESGWHADRTLRDAATVTAGAAR